METPPPRFRGLISTGDAIGFVGVAITIALAYSQWKSNKVASELQHEQASMKIAVGILSARAPKDKDGNIVEFEPDQQVLRRWAIQLLNQNPKLQIPEDAAEVIATGRAGIDSFGAYYTTYDYDSYDGYYNVTPKAQPGSPPANAPRGER